MNRQLVKYFLISWLLSLCYSSKSQNPTFPVADAYWHSDHEERYCTGSNMDWYWTEFLEGDTLLAGKIYHILKLDPHCFHGTAGFNCDEFFQYPTQGIHGIGGIREENGQVIYKKFDVSDTLFNSYDRAQKEIPAGREILIYDLNWSIGDSISYPLQNGDSIVFEVLQIHFENGKHRFTLHQKNKPAWHQFDAIEGMGGKYGLFNMYYADLTTTSYAPLPVCFYSQGILIQTGSCSNPCMATSVTLSEPIPTLPVYPNPAQNKVVLDLSPFSTGTITLRIYNTLNQLVQLEKFESFFEENKRTEINIEPLPAGFYTIFIFSNNILVGCTNFIVCNKP